MKNLRNEFPIIGQYTYLNTAATGLLSETVFDYRQDQNLDMLTQASMFRDQKSNLYAEVREALAHFYKAEANKVALVPSFSFGFNSLLEGLPKDAKILLLKGDYPSINLPIEARNFDISYAEIDENLEMNISAAVKEHQPDVFMFSVVQYVSGIKIDLDFIKELKKNNPKLLIVGDGTQFFGSEVFNFENSGFDILGASAYKWLNAGFGNAFFLFKEEVVERVYPKAIGFGSNIGKYKQEENTLIGKFEPGHLDTSNLGSIKAALKLQSDIGVEAIEQQVNKLKILAKAEFEKLKLLEEKVVKRKAHSSIFNIKGNAELFNFLNNNAVICSQRGNGIRVSFHYYNTEEDLEKLLSLLQKFRG
ncbi:aminotransferase class V-fold PLP-dependent enzyme [Mesonia aestuariivivens]|uniref:Aminotransferase class V-fold PLP-dependent enzyme n=1 Tax=Mesonia aestuariivivens TaxID=2796128 RepID=A0ABS6W4X6_9FLAO|nr:aminotransferase class V-fold PLP-dependent enzyme [Mesonia aestuariivivens]MBW2962144.1 aminotransferase class V-fold PLP-dependent enzyme [Mesonia aestuariivivens]